MFKKLILFTLLSIVYLYSQAIIPARVIDADNLNTMSVINLEIDTSKVNNDNPELGILANEFKIYGVSNSSQTSIINGHVTNEKKLIISLGPKKAGHLVIPPIKIGNDQTNPININVSHYKNQPITNSGNSNNNKLLAANNPTIIFETNTNINKVYLNNPFIYTIKLYFNVPIGNVRLENFDIPNAQIEPYDKTKQYQEHYKNQDYMVVEQKFIVTPTKSGVLHIPAAKIQGTFGNTNDQFGNPFFSLATPFIRTSKAIDIEVLAKPQNINLKDFFPAQQVTVIDDWSITNNATIDIGTPINHNITITAVGASLANFPVINESQLTGFSYYEDKPKTDTKIINNQIVTTKTYKFTLIPKEAGKYTFNSQSIKWLNVQTESLENIVLQGRIFEVNRDKQLESKIDNSSNQPIIKKNPLNLKLLISILIALTIIILILYIGFRLFKIRQNKLEKWSNVIKALKHNNLELLIQNILIYVEQQTHKQMLTLDDVAKYYNSEVLYKLADKLNQAKYKNQEFQEAELLVKEIQKICNQKSKADTVELKELYPK